MRTDLDQLMQARGLNALIVAVDHNYNPPLDYLTGGIKITKGLAIKPYGKEPVLFVGGMEREEAAVSGLTVHTFPEVGWLRMLDDADGDHTRAEVVFWGHCLKMLGVDEGTIGIYGVGELNIIVELVRLLEAHYDEYTFKGETGVNLFTEAAVTKDADEIARLQAISAKVNAVLEETWAYISGHREQDGAVVDADGQALTIGAVKGFIRKALLDYGLEDTGMIFAQGRDGGIPHSRGQDDMALKTGETIVFDLFPRELGGGFHHDMTRTWCINYAPTHLQAEYDTVMEAFDVAVEAFGVGKHTHLMQEAVQSYLEGKGHPTARSHPGTTEGYVHGLGHGIGLQVHESPRINHVNKDDIFEIGNVITIEPGVYYPDRGYGIRIEDTFYVSDSGELISLTPFRKDLILPLQG